MNRSFFAGCFIAFFGSGVFAHPPAPEPEPDDGPGAAVALDPIEVNSVIDDPLGIADSASSGIVGRDAFELRPLFRNGELLEVIPGMIATQHSGSGKANQYFLRGFNLDHGTDFSVRIDGVPFNLRTHGHGQGYLDINSLIPELVDSIEFGKGPYYTKIGDFSSAGYTHIDTVHRLEQGFAQFEIGTNDYYRLVAANSHEIGDGDLLYGGELTFYRGPWTNAEDLQKFKAIVKYTGGDYGNGYSVIANAYSSGWNSTDQIPLRAVRDGRISPLDAIDPTDGGRTQRYSLSGSWWRNGDTSSSALSAYAYYYDLNLWSNFTFVLEDEINGDQFEQVDRRFVVGGEGRHTWYGDWDGIEFSNSVGVQVRHDYIPEVALFRTRGRRRLGVTSDARVNETSLGLYIQNETQWLEKLRTVIGARGDLYWFDVEDKNRPINSGSRFAGMASPKFSMVLGPWYETEYYINAGAGFHSNDARGTTIRVDPVNGEPVPSVDPLVKSRGAEIGLRSRWIPDYTTTLAAWYLHLDSELVFVGDAATTEPSGASQRYGIEWTNRYRPFDWLTLDADLAFTHAEFTNAAPGQWRIPNSVGRVITLGATGDWPFGLFGSVRMRYFDDIPLTEDGSVEAPGTMVWNLNLGYRYQSFKIAMEIFNLFDSGDHDITYFYASRLPGEPAGGIEDIHFHPLEPRQFRFTLSYAFE